MALIDKESLVCIGRVVGAHGLKGELKVEPLTDVPEYYQDTPRVILNRGEGLRIFDVRYIRASGRGWLFALRDVNDREAARQWQGAEVLLDRSRLKPLEAGEYFMDDLIGCEVEDLTGVALGKVNGVIETGANDVLEVATPHGETLVPMTAEVVREVNTDARRIRIDPIPGLFGGEE